MFSSRSFMVSGLTFNSLIHFELIFVSGVSQGSIFILLHVNIQLFQHYLLKKIVFSPLSIPGSLVKYYLVIYAWVYFWIFGFCSIGRFVYFYSSTILY